MLRRSRRLPHQLGPIASRGRQEEDGQECRLISPRAQKPFPQAARLFPVATANSGRN